jgi:hypothetical protein
MSTPPKLPTTNSLEGAALAALILSHLSFLGDAKSYCLRSPICNLKKAGFPITDRWEVGGVSRFSGKRKKYKVYFFTDEAVNLLWMQLGKRLPGYIEAVKKLEAGAAATAHAGEDTT